MALAPSGLFLGYMWEGTSPRPPVAALTAGASKNATLPWSPFAMSAAPACRVALVHQDSRAACVEGRSFGCYGGDGQTRPTVWVRGCRGSFRCGLPSTGGGGGGDATNPSVVECGFPPGSASYQCPCDGRRATNPAAPLLASFLSVAKRSICPLAVWADVVSPFLSRDNMVLVNVGANKGYAVQDFMQRYAANSNPPNAHEWKSALLAKDPNIWRPCGACSACKAQPPLLRHNASSVRAYAIEFMSHNVKLLKHMYEKFKVPGAVLHHAVSNNMRIVHEPPADTPPGDERWGVHTVRSDKRGEAVRSITLDKLAADHGIDRINHLSADTEGNDGLVLEGAKALIEAQRIDLIEFEYHSQGAWVRHKGRTLQDIISWLFRNGYECFWQGNFGRVAPASGPFWQSGFEFRAWSNLVCSYLPEVRLALYKMSILGSDQIRSQDKK